MEATPETIFRRARILTGDPRRPAAQAIAVSGGRILAVGSDEQVLSLSGRDTAVVDVDRAVVVPGFHDAHLHLSAGSVALHHLDLRDCRSVEEVGERVQARARRVPPGAWVRGWGWDHTGWAVEGWPTRGPLDLAAPEHPVFLSRIDGHVGWVNARGLRALGIERDSPDPDGGRIVRDARSGECTGILLERAMEQAQAWLPPESDAERILALEDALDRLARRGITSAGDVAEPWALPIYERLIEKGRLTARVLAWLPLEMDRVEAEGLRERHPADDPWLATGVLKVYLDGTLGSRSAALIEPYADEPSTGMLRADARWLGEHLKRADAEGWSVAMHAIGDRAVRTALDSLALLPRRGRRRPHRIEHAQLVAPEDLTRFRALEAVASVQPSHLLDDLAWLRGRIGDARARAAYPWRSLLDAGATVAFGSDWPIGPLNPLRGISAAIARGKEPDAPPIGAEEAISFAEALAAYTRGPAVACGRARDLGILRPSFLADFVVLSDDPSEGDGTDVEERVRVLKTVVAGRVVHPKTE